MSPTFTTRLLSGRSAGETRRTPLVLEPSFVGDLEPIILSSGSVCLGAGEDCDVRLNVRGVAPRHCLIVAGASRTVVKTLSPMTWLNDGLVREAALRCGDRLTLGPLEFHVRDAFPSELSVGGEQADMTARRVTDAVDILWDEAAARRELVESAARSQAEYCARSEHRIDLPARTRADSNSTVSESLAQQREYLTQLADSLTAREQELTAREHELTAREAELRCRWQEIESGIAAIRNAERDAAAREAEWRRRKSEQDVAGDQIEADRSIVTAERARLEGVRIELDAQQASLQVQRSELAEAETRLRGREAELAELEERLASDRAQLAEVREALVRQAGELAQREADLNGERAALDFAQARSNDGLLNFETHPGELTERDRLHETLQCELREQERSLADERARLELLQSDCEQRQQDIEQAAVELQLQRSEFDFERAELETQRAALLSERQQLDAARESLIAEQATYEVDQRPSPEDADAAGARTLQAEWDELARARTALEAERAEFVRQLQEFAAATKRPDLFSGESETARVDEAVEALSQAPDCGGPDSIRFVATQPEWSTDQNELPSAAPDTDPAELAEGAPASLPEHWESLHAALTAQLDPATVRFDADSEVITETHVGAPNSEFPTEPSSEAEPDEEVNSPAEVQGETRAAADDDAVLSLRSRLAELFGIAHAQPAPDAEHPAQTSQSLAASSFADQPYQVDEPQLQEFEVVDDAAPSGIGFDAADEPNTFESCVISTQPDSADASEDDSITAYMERLLARSRQIAPQPVQPESGAALQSTSLLVPNDESAPTTADGHEEEAVTQQVSVSKALSQPDKDQLRANLDSFRELANISARSAVAKHESKKLHTVVQFKFVMLAIAVGLSLALWAAHLMNRGSYLPYAIAASVAAAVMAGEVVRTLLAFYRWKSVESATLWDEAQGEEPAAAPEAETLAE